VAINHAMQNAKIAAAGQVWFVVVEIPDSDLEKITHGDEGHHGPCAKWVGDHMIHFEFHGLGMLDQYGEVSVAVFRAPANWKSP